MTYRHRAHRGSGVAMVIAADDSPAEEGPFLTRSLCARRISAREAGFPARGRAHVPPRPGLGEYACGALAAHSGVAPSLVSRARRCGPLVQYAARVTCAVTPNLAASSPHLSSPTLILSRPAVPVRRASECWPTRRVPRAFSFRQDLRRGRRAHGVALQGFEGRSR